MNDQCTACGVCARACPTAALRFSRDEDGSYQLCFSPAACIDCDRCREVCAPAALAREPVTMAELRDEDELVLAAGQLRTCAKCKTQFAVAQNETLCPLCAFRRKHPFGSAMPPGLNRADLLDRTHERRNHA